jgi:hypothetical protein
MGDQSSAVVIADTKQEPVFPPRLQEEGPAPQQKPAEEPEGIPPTQRLSQVRQHEMYENADFNIIDSKGFMVIYYLSCASSATIQLVAQPAATLMGVLSTITFVGENRNCRVHPIPRLILGQLLLHI